MDEHFIHGSHEMTEWENSVVTLIATSRFGSIRECKKCGAEQAETVCGKGTHKELNEPCSG